MLHPVGAQAWERNLVRLWVARESTSTALGLQIHGPQDEASTAACCVVITSVAAHTPAATAGLLGGDIIHTIDGRTLQADSGGHLEAAVEVFRSLPASFEIAVFRP